MTEGRILAPTPFLQVGSLLVSDHSWYTLGFTRLSISRQLGSNSRGEGGGGEEPSGKAAESCGVATQLVTQDSWTLGFHIEVMAGGGAWERQ